VADSIGPLNNPWLVAVWPGMGNVATLAGSHLAAALDAEVATELQAEEFFEVQHIEVEDGLARPGHLPRNLFLLYRDPDQKRDLVIFIGEAQPNSGGHLLCRKIIEQAQQWGVQRIVTFAAMATQLHPAKQGRVFSVANDSELVEECRQQKLTLLKQGQISGLNGIMLAAAGEQQIPAVCLMGEMPYFAVNVPNPQASLAAVEAFSEMANLKVDLDDLQKQAEQVREQLRRLVERMGHGSGEDEEESDLGFTIPDVAKQSETEEDESGGNGGASGGQPDLVPDAKRRIEALFEEVENDRSKAMALKNELDRHGVFEQYEDRFLDLFRKGG